MQMGHSAFDCSPALRASLGRGLARQAIAMAERAQPDPRALFRMAAGLRPNPKGAGRLALRMRGRRGVAGVSVDGDGRSLTFVARLVRRVDARVGGDTAFHETGLIYLRATVGMIGSGLALRMSAVGFCRHAVERLIERSDLPLQTSLLPQLDAEARAIFRGWEGGARIVDAGDDYYPARQTGVWAGSHDQMVHDPDWGLCSADGRLPVFSARTFLSPAEMRPTVWLRWKDDPACRMS